MSLIGILFSLIDRPAVAMSHVVQRPRSWLFPALLLAGSMVLLVAVSTPYQIAIANERSTQMVEKIAPSLSAEQAQAMRQSSRPLTPAQYWLSTLGIGLLVAGLGWVARGAIVHFSSMAAGSYSTWGPTFAAGVWGMLPFFVRDLAQATYVLVQKRVLDHQGLSFLVTSGDWMKDSRDLLYAALSNVDLFVLWHIVLLGIGIAAATRLSRTRAIIMAIIVWAIFLALKLIPVAVGAAVTGNLMGG